MSVEQYPSYASLPRPSSPYSRVSIRSSQYQRPSYWAGITSYPAPPLFTRQAGSAPGAPSSSGKSQHLAGDLRRGKWTLAEEQYTAATIQYFCNGTLSISYGTTLRRYLAQQLHCDPMRISKKLLPGSIVAGYKMTPKVGRRGYYPRLTSDSDETTAAQEQVEKHLKTLREAFIVSLDTLRQEEDEYELLEARYRDYYHQRAIAVSAMVAMPMADGDERSPVGGGRKRRMLETEWAHHEAASTYPAVSRQRTLSYTSSSSYRRRDDNACYHQTPACDRLHIPPRLAAAHHESAMSPTPSPTSVAQQLPSLRVSLQRASLIMASKHSSR